MIWKSNRISKDMIRAINPTSKVALKNHCFLMAEGDLQKARELYDFYSEGLEELPAFDPVPASWMDNTKDTVNGIMGWLQNNSGAIVEGVNYIRGLVGKGAVQTAEEAADMAEEVIIEE